MYANLPLIVLTVMCLALAGGLAYLFWNCRKLARECTVLADRLANQDSDLIGLCAAAVEVDRRLLEQEQALRECREQLGDLKTHQAPGQEIQPYHTAIEKVKRGAGPEELIAEFGLSRSEANLLSNLYGERRR